MSIKKHWSVTRGFLSFKLCSFKGATVTTKTRKQSKKKKNPTKPDLKQWCTLCVSQLCASSSKPSIHHFEIIVSVINSPLTKQFMVNSQLTSCKLAVIELRVSSFRHLKALCSGGEVGVMGGGRDGEGGDWDVSSSPLECHFRVWGRQLTVVTKTLHETKVVFRHIVPIDGDLFWLTWRWLTYQKAGGHLISPSSKQINECFCSWL